MKPKKGDLLIIAAALCLCVVLFAFSGGKSGSRAVVTVNGETVFETDLSAVTEEKAVTLENGVEITVYPGAIWFSFSPCAGQDCVKTGKLTKAGQIAVCLPKKTVIKLLGKQAKNTPDAIT